MQAQSNEVVTEEVKAETKEKVKVNTFGRFFFAIALFCLFSTLFDITGIMRTEAVLPLHQVVPAVIGIVVFGMLFVGRI